MRKAEREYQKALTSFRRSAGQYRKRYGIDTSSYLEGVHTKRGAERALDKLKYDVERIQIDQRLEKYEKERPIKEFERERKKIERAQKEHFYIDPEKQAAYEAEQKLKQTAYDKFTENWGSMDEVDYDRFVQLIGAMPSELREVFGSHNVVEAFRTGRQYELSTTEIFEKLNDAYENTKGSQEDVLNTFYATLSGSYKEGSE